MEELCEAHGVRSSIPEFQKVDSAEGVSPWPRKRKVIRGISKEDSLQFVSLYRNGVLQRIQGALDPQTVTSGDHFLSAPTCNKKPGDQDNDNVSDGKQK